MNCINESLSLVRLLRLLFSWLVLTLLTASLLFYSLWMCIIQHSSLAGDRERERERDKGCEADDGNHSFFLKEQRAKFETKSVFCFL